MDGSVRPSYEMRSLKTPCRGPYHNPIAKLINPKTPNQQPGTSLSYILILASAIFPLGALLMTDRRSFRFLSIALSFFLSIAYPFNQSRSEDAVNQWNGFEKREFEVDGRKCLIVLPTKAAENHPWIWRTEFFGHEPQADIALIKQGWHAAYIDVQNLYGAPKALDAMDRFYDELTAKRGLNSKVVLEGFSRGGLFSLNWAARHPDRVACIYNDAPVCDFKSWPGGKGKGPGSAGDWKRCLEVYGLTEEEALKYPLNPVDNLEPLAKANIALIHVCGDADEVVPFEENSKLLADRYAKLGGTIKVISKPGVKHHPHSLSDPSPIVDFILEHSR